MNKKEFIHEFECAIGYMLEIVKAKNKDYSKEELAFGNFELVEQLGITSTEKGILVRMADKMSRISNLIDKNPEVKSESIQDTLLDLANYAIILKIYIELMNGKN